ncbi:unnamed protein product [Brassica napus]|uniref:(rape) hypothetical protein n=1 Tax=Brassica napus TaxID=3708 RepID=A0A816QZL3_BRANA|nr:unnamed protein product [Brassica napus]
MLRFLGNTLAKSCGKGRLQYRDFSSVSDQKAVSKFYGYCFKTVFGGAGFLLGMWFVYIEEMPNADEIEARVAKLITLREELMK